MASITAPAHSKSLTVSDGTHYGWISVAPEPGKPTLLFLHGYPSSSYHWHNQVQQCITAGYGMIAPDLLGYGDTSKPTEVAAYDNTIIAKHIIEILDHENVTTVVGIGHDWGSLFLATMARMHPKIFSLLIFLSVGYYPSQAPLTDIDAINAQVTELIGRPIFGYWHFHNRPDCAELMENADPISLATLSFPADPNMCIEHICVPGGMEAWIRENKTTELAPWITQEELETHGKIMKPGGMTGPLNWYKQAMSGVTHASEARANPDYAAMKFTVPTLFVGCTQDVICIPAFQLEGTKPFFDDLTFKEVDCSHWIMIEKPKEMWEIMQGWIEEKSKKV